MGKAKVAKTASKNNPSARVEAAKVYYDGKVVVPVLFIGNSTRYISAQYENGDMPCDKLGNPIPWSKLKN